MAPKKQPPFDVIRLWPVAVALVTVIGGYYTLNSRVANAEDKLTKIETKQDNSDAAYAKVAIAEATIQAKLENQDETLKDIKALIKEGLAKK